MRSNNEWKLPLNLAIGFHVLIALSTIYLPLIFKSKPEFIDIYSVSLVNLEEPAAPAASPQAAAPAQPEPPPAAKPKVIEKTAAPVKIPPKEAVPIAEEKPAETAPPAPPKAISLKPIKRKVKNKVPPDDTVKRETEKREKEMEMQQRRQLAESLKAEQAAAEEARLAAEEAEAERRLLEENRQRLSQIRSSQTSSASGPQRPAGPQGGGSTSALDAQYYAAVAARIQPFFQLPEIRTFDPSLVTVVIITIDRSGQVSATQIETSSGDTLYDQFVLKSIEAANPLPPIPPALRKQRLEMGLKFSPGGIM